MSYIDDETEQTNDFDNQNEYPTEMPKRPTWLTVLCILTLVGSGINFLSYLFYTGAYRIMPDMLQNVIDTMNNMYPNSGIDFEGIYTLQPRIYYGILTLAFAASVCGAIFMLNMRKIGFHTYTIAQILILIIPVLMAHLNLDISGLFLTIAFVIFYATFYKQMR